ncbi:MAG TPA: arginine--tRNA ligase [Stellaceae bacterium]|nr:arginine--tRNA ligase [Stellaceae bacterium]
MNLFRHFHEIVAAEIGELARAGVLPTDLDTDRIAVEPPRDPAHGDISTNAAMVLAKAAGMAPRALAERLIERLKRRPEVVAAAPAGPGFINLRLADGFWHDRLAEIVRGGPAYGDSNFGAGKRVNVEYVSANPTGPMHVGHGRGAVIGDALAALLEKVGFVVTREYYINDAGAQVDVLARSAYLRYREALGESIGAIPEGFYPGDYLKETGRALAERDGRKWLGLTEEAWLPPVRDFATGEMMALIRGDLAALGVRHDVFTSERAIVAAGAIERALAALEGQGLVYVGTLEPPKGKLPDDWEARPQTLFRSTQFGDDVDRPLKKSDGSWTYFAADIAYHLDKYRRGFDDMIDVWGADHGGYVKRVAAAVTALSNGQAALDVKLCQLVNLFDRGAPVRMSKRAGTFVTLREVVDEVGKDVFRFVMLTRRNDQALDFDYAKVVEQSKDNPVFYVQYAHARARSVLRHAAEQFTAAQLRPESLAAAPLQRLTDPAELALIRHLASWPRLVESAAETHEPHRIAFYLQELAAAFHGLWNKGKDDSGLRFIMSDAPELTMARLALVQAVAFVVASGLKVFGVGPVEEMR